MVRITAELTNVLLYPREYLALVQQTRIEVPISANILTGQEPEGADTIVEVDEDDVVSRLLDDFTAVEVEVRVVRVPTSLDE